VGGRPTSHHDDPGERRQHREDSPQWREDPVGSLPRIVLRYESAPGCFAALEQWYLDGGDQAIAKYVEEGMRPLRGTWAG